MRILVVGLLRHDSGKTRVAEALIRGLDERGYSVAPSKPVSGFNAWYQYVYLEKSRELGVLVGEDLYRLSRAAGINEYEAVGPLVLMLAPPDPEAYEWRITAYRNGAESMEEQAVLARITRCGSEEAEIVHMIVEENLRRTVPGLASRIRGLLEELNPAPIRVGRADIESLIAWDGLIAADACIERMEAGHEILVVESYNDAAAPTPGSIEAELVVAVAPGRLAVYPGEKYRLAVRAVSGLRRPWSLTTEAVLPLLKPMATMPVEPSAGGPPRLDKLLDLVEEHYLKLPER